MHSLRLRALSRCLRVERRVRAAAPPSRPNRTQVRRVARRTITPGSVHGRRLRDRDDRTGERTVVDYKTGSIATSAAEYREKVLNFEDFQLPFYYWAQTAAGDRVTRLVLLPLKEATADVLPIELEVVPAATKANAGRMDRAISGTISIDELRTARAKMTELCAMISSGTLAHFRASNDPQACRYCSYRPACRERPAPNEDRFGR